MVSAKSQPVIFVVGSTASGKSDWALKLAQKQGGVIVNCDSIQVYKKLDIGSAKASAEERALVPHYLIDYVSPPQEMTAGVYSDDFFALMPTLPAGPVFVVGGTGFYFMALEKGMYPVTKVAPELKAQVEAEMAEPGGAEKLYAEMMAKDPEYGSKIKPGDHYRIGRGIELLRTQGRSVTEIQREFDAQKIPFPYPLLKIGPRWDREVLRGRIAQRTQKMLQAGLIDEVRGLLDEGLKDWAPMSSVGYREVVQYLEQGLSLPELADLISTNTAQLAKKQRTWFQRDNDIQWFDGESGYEGAALVVEKFLKP